MSALLIPIPCSISLRCHLNPRPLLCHTPKQTPPSVKDGSLSDPVPRGPPQDYPCCCYVLGFGCAVLRQGASGAHSRPHDVTLQDCGPVASDTLFGSELTPPAFPCEQGAGMRLAFCRR
ncbi:unnamed protein product [Pleuronectes platessa]|uniref:Uncharacterized protein n=1 Tax=Pleuronectes platessa TaxID=8262 RepID=A0A9N7YMH5_PLEPL|nr:unnamed protein product [Pleuronectes platessa]